MHDIRLPTFPPHPRSLLPPIPQLSTLFLVRYPGDKACCAGRTIPTSTYYTALTGSIALTTYYPSTELA